MAVLMLDPFGDDGGSGTGSAPSTVQGGSPTPATPSPPETPAASPGPEAPAAAADPLAGLRWLNDIGAEIRAEIVAEHGSGTWQCPANRRVGYGSAFTCSFVPDEPGEFGPVYVTVLDDQGHYAYSIGGCCGTPRVEDYDHGLRCCDLTTDPTPSLSYVDGELVEVPGWGGLNYNEALSYWYLEGRPTRMDVGGDGVPCTTVYTAAEVAEDRRPVMGWAMVWRSHRPPADPVVDQDNGTSEVADLVAPLKAELTASYGPGTLRWVDAGLVPVG